MFILKRQDVEIVNVQNPQNKDQQIPILQYQGQTFRLLNMFGDNRDEALALWRDLTDNKGNVNSIDVYTYTIIKTGSATFTVLASQTKFS